MRTFLDVDLPISACSIWWWFNWSFAHFSVPVASHYRHFHHLLL